MKTLVVYDSMFGNTEKIARAVGDALGSMEEVQVVKTSAVTSEMLRQASLLLVGSPTHGFNPSKDMKVFLAGLAAGSLNGKRAAAFDTRADVKQINNKMLTFFTNLMGYAAENIAKQLQKKGAALVSPSEGFIVEDKEGPLREGELERATDWAKKIVA